MQVIATYFKYDTAPMHLFLDTEFTDLLHCELLSIGIVTEDGQEFYAERSDADLAQCSDFCRVAVLPLLGSEQAAICTEAELSTRLKAWLAKFEHAGQVLVSVDHPTDWELFTYLARDEDTLKVPDWIRGQSIRSSIDPRDIEEYWRLNGRRDHHALHDAKALCFAWQQSAKGNECI
ncbi:3'-5' exoribonuclease [Roseateles toxinivorans]|uniref:Uncharacterized protein DUF5051 n=1 Tax=Roseateles toxinivorans TaxID=270368 RepID=A0A4R6QQI8_9BURK|nr:3'-5' exoribonuclease [Roseateles toxinivorans]TDP72987.1 uncharacterized protein DUF5051 [Roseateles toxinivorans]